MRSIGLDFDNVGRLYQIKPGVFVDSYGYHNYKKTRKISTYKGHAPVEIDGKFWEPYSPESIESMKLLIAHLVGKFPALKGDTWRLVGHEDVRSTKSDPGPACPMAELREILA